ncbi:hypothetical protein D0809_20790 [Flavobacterium circumlabens]|uniref:Uncharacterized protein n=1 Tax=Flavobacterium circumlabens TaxID=2133765 RepID=A0A4Y7U7B0_9FLAO|nr:DUF6790 family protein [Flavobacterium circumlabens]TCN53113.1 hypothetical protein EV142_10996 [Flavobacterium circumlabens]TEB42336.1 hypothetical protein D0809_20790 [Flavobacterium circumlabens]
MTTNKEENKPNLFYMSSVTVLTFVIPVVGFLSDHFWNSHALTFELFSKWFIFSAVGLRLFLAGIKQVKNPEFTAKVIFELESTESFPILRELGFANICFGLVGIVSLYKPEWRIVSAFASGIYYGIAGLQHAIKKTSNTNEKVALVTDLTIFVILFIYFVRFV